MKSGIFINLDRCTERRDALLEALRHAGLNPADYCRLAAIEPRGDEPELRRGLKSRGELGIWRSLIRSLELIASLEFEAIVHILEDDIWMPTGLAGMLSSVKQLMLTQPRLQGIDIVFLDYVITRELFALILQARQDTEATAGTLTFLPAASHYLASCSSFLIRRSAAPYLAESLRRILASPNRLPPVDLALRSLLQIGVVNGVLIAPPLTSPNWEQDEGSSIQTEATQAARRSQRAHLLFRLLANQQVSPHWCAERLAALYEVSQPLTPSAGPAEFLAFFDTLLPRMAAF